MARTWAFLKRLPERVVALALLILSLPTLVMICVALRIFTDEPVLLNDKLRSWDGALAKSYRFRTTGRGSVAFREIGRFVRLYNLDEFPSLWSVVTGELRLRDTMHIWKIT